MCDGGHCTYYFYIKCNGRKQGCSRFYQGHSGSQFLPDSGIEPDEGHCCRYRSGRCLQRLLQDAEWRPGCKENHHAYHRRLYRIHRTFGSSSAILPVILSRHDNESGRLPCIQGIAEAAGVYGHTWPFPHSGSGSHRRIIRRLHRLLNRFGKGCRIHSHDGHGTGGTDNHLHQAAWRTPQQEKGKRYLYLQKPEKRTVNHFIQYGTQKEKNI